MVTRTNGAPLGDRMARLYQVCGVAPFIVTIVICVYFRTWPGVIAGVATGAGLAYLWEALRRRLDARAAFAAWATYIDPGFTGQVDYQSTHQRAPRRTGDVEEESMYGMVQWLLADGAILTCARGSSFAPLPGGPYLAAPGDEEGASFTLYDQTTHIRYDYEEDNARALLAALLGADSASGAAALAAVLKKAECTPLVAWRGLRLPESELPDLREDVLRREITPQLALTATLALPADCRILADPSEHLYEPIRRLGVNGFATPYYCENLDGALASEEGTCLLVKGAVIYDDFQSGAARWYYRAGDGTWTTLEDCLRDGSGKVLGQLLTIKSLDATRAVFSLVSDLKDAAGACLQASSRALPFKVAIDRTDGAPVCVVPLQKFV